MYLRLWGGLLSLGIRLQAYMASSLVLRWHTQWLAGGEQVGTARLVLLMAHETALWQHPWH